MKSGRKLFFDEMGWVIFVCTIGCLGVKGLYCGMWVSCVVKSGVNWGGVCFNNFYKINVNNTDTQNHILVDSGRLRFAHVGLNGREW